jgi:NAD+ synthase
MELIEAKETITGFIRTSCAKAGCDGVVVGLSGGVDSSLTACLSTEALGPENVLGIHMPELNITPAEDVLDATHIADLLGIGFKTVNISEILEAFLHNIPETGSTVSLAEGNLKARIRMAVLYYHANRLNYLVAGTGNKTELLLGYFTKYGDGGVDIEPIGDLFKTEVFRLAGMMNVPEGIITKPPSAALWEGQTDEGELGLTYEMIDRVLKLLEEGTEPGLVQSLTGVPEQSLAPLLGRIDRNLHKREAPPVASLDHLRP